MTQDEHRMYRRRTWSDVEEQRKDVGDGFLMLADQRISEGRSEEACQYLLSAQTLRRNVRV